MSLLESTERNSVDPLHFTVGCIVLTMVACFCIVVTCVAYLR